MMMSGTYGEEGLILPPGFRFHPTDEELITHYLCPKMVDGDFSTGVIGDVDLNKVEPWDLPWKGKMGEKEWYFFCKKDRKYPTGLRTNRATEAGYWKATGKDKEIFRAKVLVGMKKTLVFYKGRAPKGEKTNWVMHEFRSQGKNSTMQRFPTKNEWVISRVFKKSSGGKKVHISELRRASDSPLIENSTEETAGELTTTTTTTSPNNTQISEGNSGYYDSVLAQDQSLASLLLGAESLPVITEETGLSAAGFRPFYDHELVTGSGGFDCSWNYSFLLG